MTENLGKLESVRGISPVFKQRAFVVAVVSFVFFTAMAIAYLVRPGFVFVLLGTAFLVVGLFTLFGWLAQKKAEFKLFENGFAYKKFVCLWNEIESINVETKNSSISGAEINCRIRKINNEEIVLTNVIEDMESIVKIIRGKINAEARAK